MFPCSEGCPFLQVDVSDDGVIWRSLPLQRWASLHAAQLPTNRALELELAGYGSAESSARLVWLLRPSREWFLDWGICKTKGWLLTLAACVFGSTGNGRLGTLSIAINCALSVVILFVIIMSLTIQTDGYMIPLGEESSAATIWRRMIVNASLTALLVWEGPFMVDILCLSFIFIKTLVIADYAAASNAEPGDWGATAKVEWEIGLVVTLFSLLLVSLQVSRWYVRTWVERLVLGDMENQNAR